MYGLTRGGLGINLKPVRIGQKLSASKKQSIQVSIAVLSLGIGCKVVVLEGLASIDVR